MCDVDIFYAEILLSACLSAQQKESGKNAKVNEQR